MKRRKSARRKRRLAKGWNLRRHQRAYKDNRELHTYEDRIILPLIIERGSACVNEWCAREPERWRPDGLVNALERMTHGAAPLLQRGRRSTWWGGKRGRTYTVRQSDTQEEAA